MNLKIYNPELLQRVTAQIQNRRLQDVDELIEKALDALDEKDEKSPPSASPNGSLHEFFMNSPLRGANLDLERTRDYPL